MFHWKGNIFRDTGFGNIFQWRTPLQLNIQSLLCSQGKEENLNEKGELLIKNGVITMIPFFSINLLKTDVEHTKLLKPQKYCKKGAVSLRQPLIINPIVPKHPYWTEWSPYKFWLQRLAWKFVEPRTETLSGGAMHNFTWITVYFLCSLDSCFIRESYGEGLWAR